MMCTLFWYVAVLLFVSVFCFSSRCFSCYVGVAAYMMCTLFSMSALSFYMMCVVFSMSAFCGVCSRFVCCVSAFLF